MHQAQGSLRLAGGVGCGVHQAQGSLRPAGGVGCGVHQAQGSLRLAGGVGCTGFSETVCGVEGSVVLSSR